MACVGGDVLVGVVAPQLMETGLGFNSILVDNTGPVSDVGEE